jgi:hypothetical protein
LIGFSLPFGGGVAAVAAVAGVGGGATTATGGGLALAGAFGAPGEA